MAIHDAAVGKTFFTWTDASHQVRIASYNHVDGVISDAAVVGTLSDGDAHRNPSLLIDGSGYIYVFWGSHGDDTNVSKSNNPHDISAFTAAAAISGVTAYPQPHELYTDNIHTLYRSGNDWAIRRSTNGATSWGTEGTLFTSNNTNGVCYAICVSEEGSAPRKLHVVWTVLDISTQVRKHFWYATATYNVSTTFLEWAKSDGTSYTTPITTETDAEKIFDSGTDQVNTQDIRLDSSGNPYVLISHGANGGGDAEDGGSWYFKLLKKKSGTWQSFDITQGDHQFDNGGLVILADDDFRAILPTSASQINQDGGNMEEWKSTDQGETWTKVATLTSDPLSHNNVKVPRGHQPGFRAFWSYGDSESSSDVTLRRYGSDGVTIMARS